MAIAFSSMEHSSVLSVDNFTFGERLITMMTLLMCFCRNDERVRQRIDSLNRYRRNKDAAAKIVANKLKSYGGEHRELIPGRIHDTCQYANSRTELSHQSTGVREDRMRRFKPLVQDQRFLAEDSTMYINSI